MQARTYGSPQAFDTSVKLLKDPAATALTGSMLGWGTGADWDEVYRFFERGNAYTLRKLQSRFVEGPVDWRREHAPLNQLQQK